MKFYIKGITPEIEEAFMSETPNQRILRYTGRVFVDGSLQLSNGTTMDVKRTLKTEDVDGVPMKMISEKIVKDIFEGEKL